MRNYGLDGIFDRVLSELVAKMKEMKMDKAEIGCLRAIVLYNPGRESLSPSGRGAGPEPLFTVGIAD